MWHGAQIAAEKSFIHLCCSPTNIVPELIIYKVKLILAKWVNSDFTSPDGCDTSLHKKKSLHKRIIFYLRLRFLFRCERWTSCDKKCIWSILLLEALLLRTKNVETEIFHFTLAFEKVIKTDFLLVGWTLFSNTRCPMIKALKQSDKKIVISKISACVVINHMTSNPRQI